MRRMDTLKQMHDAWACGKNVIVFDEEDENIWQLCPCKLYVPKCVFSLQLCDLDAH